MIMRIVLRMYLLWTAFVPIIANAQNEEGRFKIRLLPLNTSRDEIFPTFYGNQLYFISAQKIKSPIIGSGNELNYYLLPHPDSSYLFRKRIFLAQKKQEQGSLLGASYLTATNTIFYARQLAKRKGVHLYAAHVSDNVWYSVVPILDYLPDTVVLCCPSVSQDGRMLYFAAHLPEGMGGMDIYVMVKDSTGKWSEPFNLGPSINSPYDEITPFIHSEGNLYFSSNRPNGFGGYDIYESPFVAGKLQEGKLMPPPFNSDRDDVALIMSESQRVGYFSSNRRGNYDIYAVQVELLHVSRHLSEQSGNFYRQFDMELSGTVIDTANRQPIRGALVKLRDLYDDQIRITFTDNIGNYHFTIKNDHKYEIGVSKVGYRSSEDIEFSTIGITEPISLNINLLMALPLYRQSLRVQVWEADVFQKSYKTPISDAILVLEDIGSGERYEKRSQPDGSCTFIIEQGRTYKLFAEAAGYQRSLPYRIVAHPRTGQLIEMNVELPREEVTDDPSSRYIKTIVVNQDSNKPLVNAIVYLTNPATAETRFLYTDMEGTAIFKADSNAVYKIEAQLAGYQMEDYMIFAGKDIDPGKTQELLLPLKPVEYNPIPLDVTLPTIYYNADREILSEEVKNQLTRVLQLMKEYPGIRVAIEAHAGTHEAKNVYEIALKRANAAAAYLFKNGIARQRVVAIRSFGAERQRYNCQRKECTPEQKRANRRVEFIIVYR